MRIPLSRRCHILLVGKDRLIGLLLKLTNMVLLSYDSMMSVSSKL